MKVRIVCYEDVDSWILGKFAKKLHLNMEKMGIQSSIAKIPDPTADINHHIIYYDYDGKKNSIDTVMITHIDNLDKHMQLERQLKEAELGICMSKETMNYLASSGIPASRLAYVLPAHDQVVTVRKIVVGITCRVQEDGRKREYFLDRLATTLDGKLFKFVIMGDGWDAQVASLKQHGFEVEYDSAFNYDKYIRIIPTFDYYLYMGLDEGQMGFVDALAAGVKTVVTAQGYHLDAVNGITHPFKTYEELLEIFQKIENEKRVLIDSVKTWNWSDYTLKHVQIWKYLISKRDGVAESKNSEFTDGLASIGGASLPGQAIARTEIRKYRVKLFFNYFYHQYFTSKKIGGLKGGASLFEASLKFLYRCFRRLARA